MTGMICEDLNDLGTVEIYGVLCQHGSLRLRDLCEIK